MEAFVGFQPQFAGKLDDRNACALPMAGRCLGERLQLLRRQLAYRRRESDTIYVPLGGLDDLRRQRPLGVVIVPE